MYLACTLISIKFRNSSRLHERHKAKAAKPLFQGAFYVYVDKRIKIQARRAMLLRVIPARRRQQQRWGMNLWVRTAFCQARDDLSSPRARKLNQTSTREIKESRCAAEGQNGLFRQAALSTACQKDKANRFYTKWRFISCLSSRGVERSSGLGRAEVAAGRLLLLSQGQHMRELGKNY